MADKNENSKDAESMEAAEIEEPMDTDQDDVKLEQSEEYKKLIAFGFPDKVTQKLEEFIASEVLSFDDLDQHAVDGLKMFSSDEALEILKEFEETNLEFVSCKSAYLCASMKVYRRKNKMKVRKGSPSSASPTTPKIKHDYTKIKELLDRTGYSFEVTPGQRKYGGPPPEWDGPQPGAGCRVFCGKIPKDVFEDELVPLFEKCGKLWDFRLMMDPITGQNKGFAFMTFCDKDGAQNAVKQLDKHDIRSGKSLGVCLSLNNNRLHVRNIPKNKSRDELFEEFTKHTPGLTDVIVYNFPEDKQRNRGYCFLDYESDRAAFLAKRRLFRTQVWGCDLSVDWAHMQEEPDEETMGKVKILYVRNVVADVTEEEIKEKFEPFGKIERVKKLKDFAFIHYEERDDCMKALEALNATQLRGATLEICLAKPPPDKKDMRGYQRRQKDWDRNKKSRFRGNSRDQYDYDYFYNYYGGYADPYYDEYYSNYYDDDYYGGYDSYYDDYYGYSGSGGAADYGYTPNYSRTWSRSSKSAQSNQRGGNRRGGGGSSSSIGTKWRGGRGGGRQRGGRGNYAGKRKLDGDQLAGAKRRFQNQSWY